MSAPSQHKQLSISQSVSQSLRSQVSGLRSQVLGPNKIVLHQICSGPVTFEEINKISLLL